MQGTWFDDVKHFNRKFEIVRDPTEGELRPQPAFLSPALQAKRDEFLDSEREEFRQAVLNGDLVEAADAIGDQIYVLLGTADLMHLPMNAVWEAIHRSNLDKVRDVGYYVRPYDHALDRDRATPEDKWIVVDPDGRYESSWRIEANANQRAASLNRMRMDDPDGDMRFGVIKPSDWRSPKEEIRRALQEMGYTPDPTARRAVEEFGFECLPFSPRHGEPVFLATAEELRRMIETISAEAAGNVPVPPTTPAPAVYDGD